MTACNIFPNYSFIFPCFSLPVTYKMPLITSSLQSSTSAVLQLLLAHVNLQSPYDTQTTFVILFCSIFNVACASTAPSSSNSAITTTYTTLFGGHNIQFLSLPFTLEQHIPYQSQDLTCDFALLILFCIFDTDHIEYFKA